MMVQMSYKLSCYRLFVGFVNDIVCSTLYFEELRSSRIDGR